MRMQHNKVLVAALVLLAGFGPWGGGPLRAGDEPADPAKQDEENRKLFRDEAEFVPALRDDLLVHVTDSTGLPVLPEKPPSEKDTARYRAYLNLLDEWESYCDAVAKAAKTPSRVFAHYARPDLTYAHLFNEPRKYHGEVVHFEGDLHRVRRYDPPLILAQAGVQNLYEGWLFSKTYGLNPVCLVFTDLPRGVPVAEQTKVPASFDGYFFKKYRYKAGDSTATTAREVPLVIGHAPVVPDEVAGPSVTGSYGWMGFALLVLILGTLVLAIALHWWFRRSDSQVRRRLAGARAQATPPLAEPLGEAPGDGGEQELRFPSRWPADPSAS